MQLFCMQSFYETCMCVCVRAYYHTLSIKSNLKTGYTGMKALHRECPTNIISFGNRVYISPRF